MRASRPTGGVVAGRPRGVRSATRPMKTAETTPARAKALKPRSPWSAASSCPPGHGPKTAPQRPMPEVKPTAVARMTGAEGMETVAQIRVRALLRNTPVRRTSRKVARAACARRAGGAGRSVPGHRGHPAPFRAPAAGTARLGRGAFAGWGRGRTPRSARLAGAGVGRAGGHGARAGPGPHTCPYLSGDRRGSAEGFVLKRFSGAFAGCPRGFVRTRMAAACGVRDRPKGRRCPSSSSTVTSDCPGRTATPTPVAPPSCVAGVPRPFPCPCAGDRRHTPTAHP